MIFFLLCQAGDHTIRNSYLYEFPGFAERVRVASYETVLQAKRIPTGCYVFTDLERVGRRLRPAVEALYRQLQTLEPLVRLVNDPRRALMRYDLQRALYDRGINDFEVFRVAESRRPTRWPVFLRREDNHDGPIGDLIPDAEALDRAIDKALAYGHPRERLLITEFCDTSDERGITMKYGASYVDGVVVARNVIARPHWLLKGPAHKEAEPIIPYEEQIRFEARYVEENPHADQVREIFEIAGIGYGRIDYAMKNGAPRVWEINTNPTIVARANLDGGIRHRTVIEPATARLAAAILRLDGRFPNASVPIERPGQRIAGTT